MIIINDCLIGYYWLHDLPRAVSRVPNPANVTGWPCLDNIYGPHHNIRIPYMYHYIFLLSWLLVDYHHHHHHIIIDWLCYYWLSPLGMYIICIINIIISLIIIWINMDHCWLVFIYLLLLWMVMYYYYGLLLLLYYYYCLIIIDCYYWLLLIARLATSCPSRTQPCQCDRMTVPWDDVWPASWY